MSFVDPGDFAALQVVDENDLNTMSDDLVYLAARVVPVGSVQGFAGAAAPTGYLLCDGTAVSRATYAALYAITGDAYGAGNGSTTFNLPDFRQRFPMGKAASGTGSTLGGTGGSKDAITVSHNHTQNSHNHTQNAHSHTINAHQHTGTTDGGGGHTHSVGGTTGFVIGFRTDAAANGHVSGGLERETYSNIDAVGNHTHTFTTAAGGNNSNSATATNQATTATNNSAGSSGTDANLPPYQVLNYIIKF